LTLILASSSAIRRQMLEQAGVGFVAEPADVDENWEKRRHEAASEIALALAQAKALAVSQRRGDALVIGSDSVVSVDDRLFDKPRDRDDAEQHLRLFSGKRMILTSAVALARGGTVEWSHSDEARLQVRRLSDAFIEDYLEAEWPDVGYCVGVFRLEGRGVQLFDSIEGSFFTILGMPLLPLLDQLRRRGALGS
jgi:septum formation protein